MTDLNKPEPAVCSLGAGCAPKAVTPKATEAKRSGGETEEGASLLQTLQRGLLEDGPPTCIENIDGQLVYANKRYQKIADALLCQLPPINLEQCDDASSAINGQEHKLIIDGRTEYYRIHRRSLCGTDGVIRATVKIYEPITRLKATAAALGQASTRLDDITRLVSDWVWETDPSLVLTFVSPRVHAALGYYPREVIGRSLSDLPLDCPQELLALAAGGQHPPFRDIEIKMVHRDGGPLLFRLSGLPVYCPDTGSFMGYRGTAEDMTALRQREEALIMAKESAELANRSKTEVLTNMSHELRTPLTAVIGFSEVMERELFGPLGSLRYQDYATDIKESAQHLLALINDILDVAKIEAGAHELCEEEIDLGETVRAVERLVSERANRAGLTLAVATAEKLPQIKADGRKLKQALLNLMSNAIKFTPEGGRVGLHVRQDTDGSFIIEVSDTGIGIAPEDIPRVFAPFEQVDSRISRQFEGTGLGLPLSDGFVRLHGGRLTLESTVGEGTRAIIRLPAERVV